MKNFNAYSEEKSMSKKPWLNIDDFMTNQEPVPRDQWKASNPYTMQFKGDIKIKRDYSKCKVCGGTGFTYELVGFHKHRGRKRMVKCECSS